MKSLARIVSALILASAFTTALYADTFNFSFTGNNSVTGIPDVPFSGSGQFTATQVGTTSSYRVTGVTGTTMNQTISSLIGKGGYGFNDNLLFFTSGATSATLDNSGISYKLANGVLVNLFLNTDGKGQQSVFGFTNQLISEAQVATITITPAGSPVPEPGSLALLGTGALGVIGTLRRRLNA